MKRFINMLNEIYWFSMLNFLRLLVCKQQYKDQDNVLFQFKRVGFWSVWVCLHLFLIVFQDLVFALLIAEGQLIALVHMKKYLLHPIDLHMIFNLVTTSDAFKHAESWSPVCLPRFDPRWVITWSVSRLSQLGVAHHWLLLIRLIQYNRKETISVLTLRCNRLMDRKF